MKANAEDVESEVQKTSKEDNTETNIAELAFSLYEKEMYNLNLAILQELKILNGVLKK